MECFASLLMLGAVFVLLFYGMEDELTQRRVYMTLAFAPALLAVWCAATVGTRASFAYGGIVLVLGVLALSLVLASVGVGLAIRARLRAGRAGVFVAGALISGLPAAAALFAAALSRLGLLPF